MTKTQPVIWIIQKDNGKTIKEIEDNGKETIMTKEFIKEHKSNTNYIALYDRLNKATYSINLTNGKFILRGQEFALSKEHKGITYNFTCMDINYRDGLIQYKHSKPMFVGASSLGVPMTPECKTYNIGYKADLPEDFLEYDYKDGKMRIVAVQAMLSVDADSLQPSISTSFVGEYTNSNGVKESIRI